MFWIIRPCSFNPEDGGDTFLRNVRSNLQEYATSQKTTFDAVMCVKVTGA
jgi:hypothetical protein